MTKEEMIEWLEEIVKNNRWLMFQRVQAADTLASIQGWKIQSCMRVKTKHQPKSVATILEEAAEEEGGKLKPKPPTNRIIKESDEKNLPKK